MRDSTNLEAAQGYAKILKKQIRSRKEEKIFRSVFTCLFLISFAVLAIAEKMYEEQDVPLSDVEKWIDYLNSLPHP